MASRNIAIYYPERDGPITVMADITGKFLLGAKGLHCTPLNKKGEPSSRHVMTVCYAEDFGRTYGFTPSASPDVQMLKLTLEELPSLRPTMYREVITYKEVPAVVAPVPITPEPESVREFEGAADAEGEPLRTATIEA